MKKTTKILSLIMALAMMIASFSAFGIEAFAATKENRASIVSITQDGGEYPIIKMKYKAKSGKTFSDGYQLQYSEDKSFKTGVNSIRNDESSIEFTNCASDMTVYFRVRTVYLTLNKSQKFEYSYSSWSGIKSLRIEHLDALDDGAYDGHVQAQRVIASLGITDSMSDLEKVARVQNWIYHNWIYNSTADMGAYDWYNFMFYVNESGCQSFAVHFCVFMKELNIPCKIVDRGVARGASTDHFWNIIKINGYWWNYDCEIYERHTDNDYTGMLTFDTASHKMVGLSEESTKLWNSCQPHGDDISGTAVVDMRNNFNQMINDLNK